MSLRHPVPYPAVEDAAIPPSSVEGPRHTEPGDTLLIIGSLRPDPSGVPDLHLVCEPQIIQDLPQLGRQAVCHVAADRHREVDADSQVGA